MFTPDAVARCSRRRFLKVGAGIAVSPFLGRGVCGEATAEQPRLRVLSYNIHHGEGTDGKIDLPRLATVIRAAEPDLVALQEVDDKTQRAGGVDQTAELVRLAGLHGRFGKQIDYEGGGYGQAILSKFPISDLKIHRLPGMPEREQRMAIEARIEINGREISFVSTHLHHANDLFREQQAAKLTELFEPARHPVILAGDLNANPDSKPIALLSPAWKIASGDAPLATYPAKEPEKQIDYSLFRPRERFTVVETKVPNEAAASDHRPLLAVLEWRA
jgi:endonuclease/exonuclease/phosphatase family metal-dependent hydrolase